jgi:hypothetical protein
MLEVACRSSFDMAASSQPILKVPLEPQRGNPCCLWTTCRERVSEGARNRGPPSDLDDRPDEALDPVRAGRSAPPFGSQPVVVAVPPTTFIGLT